MAKAGRKPKNGERYPGGQIKPGLAPAQIKRIVAEAKRGSNDPRLGSVIGVLHLQGVVTEKQFSAATTYAKLRGQHDRVFDVRRNTTMSPDYGAARMLGASTAPMTDRAVDRVKREYAAMVAVIEGRWPLGTVVNGQSAKARGHDATVLLDHVLVDDRTCEWAHLAMLRKTLDTLVEHFRIVA